MMTLALAATIALSAAPQSGSKKTQLKIEVKPTSAVFYVDGKRKGTGARIEVVSVTPGHHEIKVVNHKDMHEEVVVVKKGETTKWSWAFEDDRPGQHQPVEPQAESAEGQPQKAEPQAESPPASSDPNAEPDP